MSPKLELKAVRDKVVILKDKAADTLPGGMIILPDLVKEKPVTGVILSVGLGGFSAIGERIPPDVKVGEKAVFPKYEGTNCVIDGDEFFIISEKHIMATYEVPNG